MSYLYPCYSDGGIRCNCSNGWCNRDNIINTEKDRIKIERGEPPKVNYDWEPKCEEPLCVLCLEIRVKKNELSQVRKDT